MKHEGKIPKIESLRPETFSVFQCGHCPVGWTGNGFYCNDIDECLANNGGCSQSPRVQCINTQVRITRRGTSAV